MSDFPIFKFNLWNHNLCKNSFLLGSFKIIIQTSPNLYLHLLHFTTRNIANQPGFSNYNPHAGAAAAVLRRKIFHVHNKYSVIVIEAKLCTHQYVFYTYVYTYRYFIVYNITYRWIKLFISKSISTELFIIVFLFIYEWYANKLCLVMNNIFPVRKIRWYTCLYCI